MAEGRGVTPAQIDLAWLLAVSPHIIPIPGTKRRNYLEKNLDAVAITLSAAEIHAIDNLTTQQYVSGDRYNDQDLAMLDN